MADFDVLIRGGSVVDGTRFPAFTADLGIRDGRVAAIGRLAGAGAKRVLDADGLIVAPGFVDLHTHYDAQIQWDPWCSISGWHGVTSVALGNCGFGFAPVRPAERERAMLTMSRLEAIPLVSMREGMLWDWERRSAGRRARARWRACSSSWTSHSTAARAAGLRSARVPTRSRPTTTARPWSPTPCPSRTCSRSRARSGAAA